MMRFSFKLVPAIAFSLLLLTRCSWPSTNKAPNVLFILVDDLGWNDLGCYGSSFYETPHIDQLAKQGFRYTNAYAASPVCSPTRAAIMTGKHPARINITDWIPGRDPKNQKLLGPEDLHELPATEYTLAEAFRDNGYQTFFAGKWHLGDEGSYPEDHGFDINKGGLHRGSPPGGYYSPYKNPKLKDGPEGEYLPDRLTTETIQFIEQNRSANKAPFFAYLSYYTVHTPIQACQRHLDKFTTKVSQLPDTAQVRFIQEDEGYCKLIQDNPQYASMVYAMDENIGRLMSKLNELGIADNTIVVFTSDNGGLSTLYHKGAPTALKPLRAGKGWCYEGGIRVPLIIKLANQSQEGMVDHTPVISMDLYPTLLDIAHISQLPAQHTDGISLVPSFNKQKLSRETLYWHFPHYHGSAWTPGAAIRHNDWKLIHFYDREKTELYHLSDDIEEQHNLAQEYPEKTKELLNMLNGLQKEMGAQLPRPNPDYSVKR
jgi:arylsulfatase A-like enzyme